MVQAELRMRPSDSPRPSSPEIPEGELVPADQWSFASCPTGPPGTPSVTDICLAADEKNRRVCDAVHIHIPGVQKLFLNYRFAQPNPFTVQHRERYVPDTNFPRHYGV